MKQKTIGTIAIVAALVAVLAVPVLAEGTRSGRGVRRNLPTVAQARKAARAGQNTGSSESSRTLRATLRGQKLAQLNKNIANKLRARKHRFDAVSANLNKRIDRIASLATTVAAAGGDVSAVNAKLDSARQHLAAALALEQETIGMFNAIPSAGNRRAAFFEARAQGRKAVAELKLTRIAIRDAAATLRVVVDGL